MKILLPALALVFITSVGYSQPVPANPAILEFSSEREARQIIHEIVGVVGLKPNFEIRAAEVANAAAITYKGKRYILYNPSFISAINHAVKTDWGGISILAHEIAHHLNGHTLLGTGSKPSIELEADEFSGFVLRRMGATLQDAQAAMQLISNKHGSPTHPARNLRLSSISKGWSNANKQMASAGALANSKPSGPAGRIENKPKPVYQFPSQYIYRHVHLHGVAKESVFVTVQGNIVEVSDSGYKVVGKMLQSHNGYYLALNGFPHFRVDSRGGLISRSNQKVGFLTRHRS